MRRQDHEEKLRVRVAASELDLAGMTITASAIYAKGKERSQPTMRMSPSPSTLA